MARIFIDGFESGSVDLWEVSLGGAVASTTQKKTGSYSLYRPTTSNAYVYKDITGVATLYFRFWIYPNSRTNSPVILDLQDGSGSQVTFWLTTGLAIQAKNGATLLGTSPALLADTWNLVEGKVFIDNTTGICELKLNGVNSPLAIDFDGDTRGSGTTITRVALGNYSGTGSGTGVDYFDDFVLDDAAWIGNTRIQAIYPTADGYTVTWTASTTTYSNWDCVNEIPKSDADNVYTNTNDSIDFYVSSNLVGSVNSILCVQAQARVVKEGSPTPTNIQLGLRSAGTDYFTVDKAVPINYKSLFGIWEIDPATSVTWTSGGVDALEIGIKSTA